MSFVFLLSYLVYSLVHFVEFRFYLKIQDPFSCCFCCCCSTNGVVLSKDSVDHVGQNRNNAFEGSICLVVGGYLKRRISISCILVAITAVKMYHEGRQSWTVPR